MRSWLPTFSPLLLGALVVLAGCGDPQGTEGLAPPDDSAPAAETPSAPVQPSTLQPLFEEAAREFKVPASVLQSVGYVETRWEMVRGEEEFPGMPAAFGVMALRGEALEQGAALAGVSVEAARSEPRANIRAAAALLSRYAEEAGTARDDVGDWATPIARYSGIKGTAGQAAYIHGDVYRLLRDGLTVEGSEGRLVAIPPSEVEPRFAPRAPDRASADYPSAVWHASPNYNDRPAGSIGQVGMVIIHDCEGNYAGCWSWLTNTEAGTSAHYVVKEDGSEISQLVLESKRAWHIGASYDCTLNSSVECWRNGASANHFTVGIEHGGFASQSTWPAAQLAASAALTCDITRAYGIPRDRFHIVGHGQLQPVNRTDPGPNWPWTDYLSRVSSACGTDIVIDSNNANNDTARGYIATSANWVSSTNVAGYYGSGYYYADTSPISDGATFWFYLPTAGTHSIDAWWTAATDRAPAAPFVMFNAAGTNLGTATANQQLNGGKWNTLGSYSFSAGWNRVVLSRWTTTGYVVIADAVRIR